MDKTSVRRQMLAMASACLDVIVIGAGAAGLMAAGVAGQRGRRVAVLEHTQTVGAKILISGGGRCNFTNRSVGAHNFLSANPQFARSALARYTPADFIALVERYGIAYYEKTLGQLFCEGAGSARRIVDLLMRECALGGARVRTGLDVRAVERGERFRVETCEGVLTAPCLIVATGGLSIPKLGATDFAFRIARRFGVPVIPPRPALTPLTFGADDLAWMRPLSGVALDAAVRCGPAAFREAILFTHRGLSGPAILQVSSYWSPGLPISLDLDPDDALGGRLKELKRSRPKMLAKTALGERLASRFVEVLEARGLPETRLGDMRDASLDQIARSLRAFEVSPSGTEGYAKAEVTAGGVDTAALDQRTMMVKAIPGLFFVGEAVDVTGWLGGYNFQWAWASAVAAGQAV